MIKGEKSGAGIPNGDYFNVVSSEDSLPFEECCSKQSPDDCNFREQEYVEI